MQKLGDNKRTITDEELDKALDEEFDIQFPDFESFKKYIEEEIKIAQRQIAEGKGIPMEVVLKQIKEEYGF